jgi:hypothetical protein
VASLAAPSLAVRDRARREIAATMSSKMRSTAGRSKVSTAAVSAQAGSRPKEACGLPLWLVAWEEAGVYSDSHFLSTGIGDRKLAWQEGNY